jgi:hypothetical protein
LQQRLFGFLFGAPAIGNVRNDRFGHCAFDTLAIRQVPLGGRGRQRLISALFAVAPIVTLTGGRYLNLPAKGRHRLKAASRLSETQ